MVDNQSILKTLIQGATVELFQCYRIAVAPMLQNQPLPKQVNDYVGGYGTFTGDGLNGTLGLLVPKTVFSLASVEGIRIFNILDWTKELTNQLFGRIKSRLAHYQMLILGAIPSALDGKSLEMRVAASSPFMTAHFRSIRGQVIVTVAGTIDYSKFQFSSLTHVPEAGDIVML
jgi:hypothetical protein